MNELLLRPYQVESVEQLRAGYRSGHRSQLLVAPTGAGKTLIATYLMREAARKQTRTAFLVDRVSLVDQTSKVLDDYGIDHGVVQAGHWRRKLYERIQVCSVQTLEKRGFFPDLQFLIVDEAHCMRKQTIDLIRNRSDVRILGLTATPFSKGMGELYGNTVNVTTTNRLIADGFLVPTLIYAAVRPDMDKAKVIAGEWSDKDITERGRAILGDIVAEWKDKTQQHFGGAVKTIVFAASVEHGAELCQAFNAAGFNFQQLSYRDTDDEARRELIAEFRKENSRITGLVSCEVLTKGFDVPDVLCGIGARPYRKSFSSHIQQLGRVMRTAPGKTFALWLDHGGNAIRFREDQEDLFEHGVLTLGDESPDAKTRKEPKDGFETDAVCCQKCKRLLSPAVTVCPSCGHVRVRRNLVEVEAGVMVSIDGKPTPAVGRHSFLQDETYVWQQIAQHALDRKKGDIDAAERFAFVQFRSIYGKKPPKGIKGSILKEPTPPVVNLIQHNIIRWARSRVAA